MSENEKQNPIRLQSAEDLKKPVKKRDPRKGRILLIALGCIVLLTALVIGVTKLAQAVSEYIELNTDHTIRLSDTTTDKVRKIAIQGKTAVTITRSGDQYVVRELSESVTSQSACEAAFANAAQLLAESVAAQDVTDFTDFGLDDPASTVVITYADGELTLEIGALAPASQYYYVRVDGGDTVYLMRKLIVDMYSDGISAYRDISGFAVSIEALRGLTIERGGEAFSLEYHDKIGGAVFTQWQIVQPAAANTDGAKVEEALSGFESIALQSFVKTAREDELEKYGLEAPDQVLTLAYADDSLQTIYLGGSDSSGNVYARFDDSYDIYLIQKDTLTFLDGFEFRQLISEFASIVSLPSVDALDIEMDSITARIEIDRSGEDPVYTMNGGPLDADAFKTAFQALNTLPINGFADSAENAMAKLSITYTFNTGEAPYTVEYLDSSINNYALRKAGIVSVTVSKDACDEALALLAELMQ